MGQGRPLLQRPLLLGPVQASACKYHSRPRQKFSLRWSPALGYIIPIKVPRLNPPHSELALQFQETKKSKKKKNVKREVRLVYNAAYIYLSLKTLVYMPALCCAIYPMAHAADSLTVGSNSSRHGTKASKAPESTTALASSGECLATARNTKAAAFL